MYQAVHPGHPAADVCEPAPGSPQALLAALADMARLLRLAPGSVYRILVRKAARVTFPYWPVCS